MSDDDDVLELFKAALPTHLRCRDRGVPYGARGTRRLQVAERGRGDRSLQLNSAEFTFGAAPREHQGTDHRSRQERADDRLRHNSASGIA